VIANITFFFVSVWYLYFLLNFGGRKVILNNFDMFTHRIGNYNCCSGAMCVFAVNS